jgi:Pyruvate/2-oxoacid:ferredoxin oxidoreductase delta subunit
MKRLVICSCATHHRVAGETVLKLQAGLSEDWRCEIIDDLCGLAVSDPGKLADLAEADAVAACFPRAVLALFRSAGTSISEEKLIDLRQGNLEQILTSLGAGKPRPVADPADLPAWTGDWIPWYPVIDQSRCVNCGLCADFCLFGVYSRLDGNVRVTQPANCKTNCPACARICPETAIIFPKHEKSPINGGELIEEELPVDPSQLRQGSTYEALVSRRRNRRKLLKDS